MASHSSKLLLCFMPDFWFIHGLSGKQTTQSTQRQPPYRQNSVWCVFLNINVVLKPTVCGVISTREPRRWKMLNISEFFGPLLRLHEWSHSQPWMGLCATLKRSWASLKIQVNSPMRLGLEICHGDQPAWAKHEPVPHYRLQEDCVCWREAQVGENSLFGSGRSLDVLSLAVPAIFFFFFPRLLTDQTITN